MTKKRDDFVIKIRSYLKQKKAKAFILSHDDSFFNESLTPDKEVLAYATNFKGSSGIALMTPRQSLLFVDGRYVAQAKKQSDFKIIHSPKQGTVSDTLAKLARKKDVILYDPWVHCVAQVDKWAAVCAQNGARLIPVDVNPVYALWKGRPAPKPVLDYTYPKRYAGKTTRQKINPVKGILRAQGLDGFVVTAADTVSWLLNKRSDAVPYSPVYLGRCYVSTEGQITALNPYLMQSLEGKVVGIDPYQTPAKIKQDLIKAGASVRPLSNPFALSQAVKNKAEMAGMRQACVLDSAALCQFFCDLDRSPTTGTEVSVLQKLETYRRASLLYKYNSFAPISAVGKNAALPHYVPVSADAKALKSAPLYLLDTGGQYWGGTTDTTRTVALARPTLEMKKRYTQVLKGHIALASARFPDGTTGAQLDVLARQFLWQDGEDFDHGTGHGVGAFLNVHEMPPTISPYAKQALLPDMIVTNEPAFYAKGQYGIRLENMMAVRRVKKGQLCFDVLTLIPFCDELIQDKMLTETERAWLEMYYRQIMEQICPMVNAQTQKWLKEKSAKWLSKSLSSLT